MRYTIGSCKRHSTGRSGAPGKPTGIQTARFGRFSAFGRGSGGDQSDPYRCNHNHLARLRQPADSAHDVDADDKLRRGQDSHLNKVVPQFMNLDSRVLSKPVLNLQLHLVGWDCHSPKKDEGERLPMLSAPVNHSPVPDRPQGEPTPKPGGSEGARVRLYSTKKVEMLVLAVNQNARVCISRDCLGV